MQKDSNNFVELGHMERDYFYLQEMRNQLGVLEAAIKRCETAFKTAMEEAEADGFTIGGVPKISWKKDATFPVKKFTDANPHVAAVYVRKVEEFDLEAFKRERSAEYELWRGRSFKHIQPKRG